MSRRRAGGPPALLLAALVLAAGGCGDPRPPAVGGAPPAPVRRILDLHGATPALRARLALRLVQDGGEPRTLDLDLWRAPDGRLRARLSRLDVAVLDLRLDADGGYLAWAPRSGLVARGRLAADQAPLAARLRLLADELAQGPLPAGARPQAEDGAWTWRQGGLTAILRTDAAGHALSKRLADDAGGVATLDYGRYREDDGLRRAARVRMQADGLDLTAVLRMLNPVAAISAEGLAVQPDPAARPADLADLLEHLE